MPAEREMRDRVAEAMRLAADRATAPWDNVPERVRMYWTCRADDLLAAFASLGLTLTTQDEDP